MSIADLGGRPSRLRARGAGGARRAPAAAAVASDPAVGRRMRRVFLAAWGALFAMMGLWTLSSPMMDAPDEPANSVKAMGVARAQPSGEVHEGVPGLRFMVVPDWALGLHKSPDCFNFEADVPASCVPDIDGSNDVFIVADTGAGTYNPLYYALVGWPSLIWDDEAGATGMRLASSLVNSAVLASGVAALAGRRRSSWSFVAAGLSVTPMVLFFGSHINISGLEMASGFAVACWLGLLVDHERRASLATAAWGVAATAAVLANTRSVGPLWLAAIAIAFLLDGRIWPRLVRSRAFWGAAALLALAGGVALWWALSQGSDEVRYPGAGAGETPFLDGAEYMLAISFETASGYVGHLGWLDTPLPGMEILLWGGGMFALVAAAIVLGRGWPRARIIAMAVAYLALPALVQGMAWNTHGFIWQARYILAVVLALLVCAGSVLDECAPPLHGILRGDGARPLAGRGRQALLALLAGLWAMVVFAFVWNQRRYVTGLSEPEVPWSAMLESPSWQPPGGWLLLAVLFAIATAAWCALLWRLATGLTAPDDVPAAYRGPRVPGGRASAAVRSGATDTATTAADDVRDGADDVQDEADSADAETAVLDDDDAGLEAAAQAPSTTSR